MSLYVDKKFVARISNRLDMFKQKSDYLWNFRCVLCGDSQKNKYKSRGYIYRRANGLYYSCHNCGASLSLGNLLKSIDKALYNEYIMEKYANETATNTPKPDLTEIQTNKELSDKFESSINLPKINSLPEDHKAKLFLINRKIPRAFFDNLYYAVDFKAFIDELIPEKQLDFPPGEKRIVIPFYDENKKLLGVQGRAIDDSKVRYISVKLRDSNRKLFGLDRIDFTKPIHVVEGPFDSLFLDNCLAVMDASLYNILPVLGPKDYIFVYDNEPRNGAVVNNVKKSIALGHKVVIWPEYVKAKDINDMVLEGLDPQQIIKENTYDHLRARLEFERWKKV